jgi:hypothetical protein
MFVLGLTVETTAIWFDSSEWLTYHISPVSSAKGAGTLSHIFEAIIGVELDEMVMS